MKGDRGVDFHRVAKQKISCARPANKLTFFIVGWIAERNIDLVQEIAQKGHRIGCHSYLHRKGAELCG